MEMSDQVHTPVVLPPGKELPVPIVEEAGWAPEPFGTLWNTEKSFTSVRNRSLAVAMPTELSWLLNRNECTAVQ
jgi:hypothetical protein